jgi:hypothetical protein
MTAHRTRPLPRMMLLGRPTVGPERLSDREPLRII